MVSKEQVWIEVLSQEWDGPMRLRVSGRSMWPTLRPGDQITVEPAVAGDLRSGDWVVLRNADTLIIHRFLGFNRHGRLVTKGDGVYALDPPWPHDVLLGRVVSYDRQGNTVPVSSSSLHQRAWTAYHRLLAGSLIARKRFRRLFPALLLLISAVCVLAGLLVPVTWASVDLVSFEATAQETSILITWQTANEIDMLAFYVCRSLAESDKPPRVSGPIPAQGDIAGSSYQWVDTDVVGGPTYYYYLEAVEISGDPTYHGPVSASLPQPTDTPAPTATLTPTPSATPTASLTPSTTPTPTRTPTSSPTPSPTLTPSTTPTPRPSPTGTLRPTRPRPTATNTRTPSPTPTPTGTLPLPDSSPSPLPSSSVAPSPTPTLTGTPPPTLSPSPSPTEVKIVFDRPPAPASSVGEATVSKEELARAEKLRNVVLIGLGVLILGGLGVIAFVLLAFAFYRWRSLRRG